MKLTIDAKTPTNSDEDLKSKINHYKELKDNRCVNVASQHLLVRVPAPCEPPIVSLTGYTSETIDIYWPRPSLYSQHRNPNNLEQKIHLYRRLIGYQLMVNEIYCLHKKRYILFFVQQNYYY